MTKAIKSAKAAIEHPNVTAILSEHENGMFHGVAICVESLAGFQPWGERKLVSESWIGSSREDVLLNILNWLADRGGLSLRLSLASKINWKRRPGNSSWLPWDSAAASAPH